ncbi:hypothetical protein ACFL0H_13715 [Thermodesulfobacteriota bacterium]
MHIYTKIYEFAASAGSLEGFVYRRKDLDPEALPVWINNLVAAYQHLPVKTQSEIQSSLDQTIGRAIRSIVSILGEENEMVLKLHTMVKGPLPKSADDFQKKKWFEK